MPLFSCLFGAYFGLLVVFANIYILIKSAVVCLCIQNGCNVPLIRSCTQPLYWLIFCRNELIIHSNERNIFIVIDIDTKLLYSKWMSLLYVWINWSNDPIILNKGGKIKRSVWNVKSYQRDLELFFRDSTIFLEDYSHLL